MSTLFYVMAVFGCGDGAVGCAEARLAGRQFATRAACESAIEMVLTRSTDVGAPTIAARCLSNIQYVASHRDKGKARLRLAGLDAS